MSPSRYEPPDDWPPAGSSDDDWPSFNPARDVDLMRALKRARLEGAQEDLQEAFDRWWDEQPYLGGDNYDRELSAFKAGIEYFRTHDQDAGEGPIHHVRGADPAP